MSTARKLKHPPIREAIFTITFKDPIPKEVLIKFLNTDFVKSHYSQIPGIAIKIVQSKSNSNIKASGSEADGFSLRPVNKETRRLIQVRSTFLSYHNLTTYDGWEIMIDELKNLWREFCGAVGKMGLTEVRVRNINNINLPLQVQGRLTEYITLLPLIPQGINPNLSGFFIQIHTSNPPKRLQATITNAILGVDSVKNILRISLDITVFKKQKYGCDGVEMWEAFDELREYKDDLFFNTITEKTIKTFDV